MFFRKDILNAKPETENTEDEVKPLPSDNRPIYIVGANALAYYLGAKLIDAGHNVIILGGKENTNISTNGITLKEDSTLQKTKYKFNTSFWIKEEPKLVIITAEAGKINSALTAVSLNKIGLAPVLCFTPLKDINYLEALVGSNLFAAYFDGFLQLDDQQLFLHGRTPLIKICKNQSWEKENPFLNIFSYTSLNISYETDEEFCFWEYFSGFAICSLMSAVHNKSIFEITKDKKLREDLRPLISEITSLAESDNVALDGEQLLKKIYNTPMNYSFPLQDEINTGKHGEINLISSVLVNASRKGKNKFQNTGLNALLKKIYNLILV